MLKCETKTFLNDCAPAVSTRDDSVTHEGLAEGMDKPNGDPMPLSNSRAKDLAVKAHLLCSIPNIVSSSVVQIEVRMVHAHRVK